MKIYKGFISSEFTKRGYFPYEVGKTYVEDSGFYACKKMKYVFWFHNWLWKGTRFYEVELGGTFLCEDGYVKKATQMTLTRELSASEVVSLCGEAVKVWRPSRRYYENTEWNFVNKDGNLLPTWFDEVMGFVSGFAMVRAGRGWNHIDTFGNLLSNTWFDQVEFFCGNQFSRVWKNSKVNFIDRSGTILLDTWVDDFCGFEDDCAKVSIGGKYLYAIRHNGILHNHLYTRKDSARRALKRSAK